MFYDTHAHLDYPDYRDDFAEVVARAQAAGITKMISIGTSLDSSERAIRLAEKFPSIYAAVGWHPSDAMKAPSDLRPALREMCKHTKVVAIGEIGLDYHRLPSMSGAHGGASVTASRLVSTLVRSGPPCAKCANIQKWSHAAKSVWIITVCGA